MLRLREERRPLRASSSLWGTAVREGVSNVSLLSWRLESQYPALPRTPMSPGCVTPHSWFLSSRAGPLSDEAHRVLVFSLCLVL